MAELWQSVGKQAPNTRICTSVKVYVDTKSISVSLLSPNLRFLKEVQ